MITRGEFLKSVGLAAAARLLRVTQPGAIVLLHDGHANGRLTVQALDNTLGQLKARGLRFAALPEP